MSITVYNVANEYKKTDKDKPILVAGDPERLHMKKSDEDGAITYHINQLKFAVNYHHFLLAFLEEMLNILCYCTYRRILPNR